MLVLRYAFMLFWNVLEINNRTHEDVEHRGVCRPTGAACACVHIWPVGHGSRGMVGTWRGPHAAYKTPACYDRSPVICER